MNLVGDAADIGRTLGWASRPRETPATTTITA